MEVSTSLDSRIDVGNDVGFHPSDLSIRQR